MKKVMNKTIVNLLFSGMLITGLIACGGGNEKTADAHANKQIPVHEAVNAHASHEVASAEVEKKEAGPAKNIGIGPIKEVKLGDIDQGMVDAGLAIFDAKCSACHKVDQRYIGPAIKGVTERRTPEWIMNMILNPEVMVKEDPTAKALLAEYIAPMANQNLTEDEARKVLEYFRTLN